MSLKNDYEPIHGQLLNRSPPSSLDIAVNELVGEEVRLATKISLIFWLLLSLLPPQSNLYNQGLRPLALAIIASSPTKSSATIASILATLLRLVIITANLLLLLLILSLLRQCLPFQLSLSLLDPLSTSPSLNYKTSWLKLFIWLVMHLFPLLSQFYPINLTLDFLILPVATT